MKKEQKKERKKERKNKDNHEYASDRLRFKYAVLDIVICVTCLSVPTGPFPHSRGVYYSSVIVVAVGALGRRISPSQWSPKELGIGGNET